MTGRRLIVEADGGSRGNPGPAAYGAVVRDAESGAVLAEVAETLGVATNNVAEYRGLLAGLRAAHGIDPDAVVEARLDSKLVVEQLSGRWKIKSADLEPLADEARGVFPPGRVGYTWVSRTENAHADRLVNQALDGKPVGAAAVHAGPHLAGPDLAGPDLTEGAATEPAGPANRLAAWSPELGPPTTLHVVRHGQTAMTAARRFSGGGVPGPSLDDTGLAQAERAAAVLGGCGAVAVVASPMVRTRETAAAVARRLGLAVRVDDAWRECEFGEWEGLTLAEIGERYPDALAGWYASTAYRPPGGESLDDVARRIATARDALVAEFPGQPVVVVTHSMPMRTLTALALGAPPETLFRLLPAPGSVTELQYYADGTTAVPAFGHRP
ncbi:bifunctional RNase H/acid phosphatase [Jiangella ureilytica]|uniref:Bifunctional RNase H/acid phosphatase n=1 Tax=Jiangella ureilytica TaxID=2530374 RepID=A0A4R4RY96_9ACTN|nr:bifunctional RNase H/acid phosphatase [Jiangella ureilytica]TDC53922.1 bifunctional RNase H/acid phosphatase [Jiangella ureilytica]